MDYAEGDVVWSKEGLVATFLEWVDEFKEEAWIRVENADNVAKYRKVAL